MPPPYAISGTSHGQHAAIPPGLLSLITYQIRPINATTLDVFSVTIVSSSPVMYTLKEHVLNADLINLYSKRGTKSRIYVIVWWELSKLQAYMSLKSAPKTSAVNK